VRSLIFLVKIILKILFKIKKRLFHQSNIRICSVRNHTVLLDVDSDIENFRADTYLSKEPETLDWVERYFRPGDVIYDVGANIGLYSLFAAKYLNGKCKIYAFEPESLNYAKLNINIYLNNLTGSIIPCCLALTDKVDFDQFYLHPDNFETVSDQNTLTPGSALHSFGHAEDYRQNKFQPFHIQGMIGVSLDYLWASWNIGFPNHIKIDVDGIEERIVAGGVDTFADRRLRSVLIEVSNADVERSPIIRKLLSVGFSIVDDFEIHSRDSLIGTEFENSVNVVFVRD